MAACWHCGGKFKVKPKGYIRISFLAKLVRYGPNDNRITVYDGLLFVLKPENVTVVGNLKDNFLCPGCSFSLEKTYKKHMDAAQAVRDFHQRGNRPLQSSFPLYTPFIWDNEGK